MSKRNKRIKENYRKLTCEGIEPSVASKLKFRSCNFVDELCRDIAVIGDLKSQYDFEINKRVEMFLEHYKKAGKE